MMELEELQLELKQALRNVSGFPKKGIEFKDITTILNNGGLFWELIEFLANRVESSKIDFVAGIESRGFIFGAALAHRLKAGFVPIRKKGKLPAATFSEKYALEYGFDELEIHKDAFMNLIKCPFCGSLNIKEKIHRGYPRGPCLVRPETHFCNDCKKGFIFKTRFETDMLPSMLPREPKVLLIDDLIATGGSAQAAINLIHKAGGYCVSAMFILNLAEFGALDKLKYPYDERETDFVLEKKLKIECDSIKKSIKKLSKRYPRKVPAFSVLDI